MHLTVPISSANSEFNCTNKVNKSNWNKWVPKGSSLYIPEYMRDYGIFIGLPMAPFMEWALSVEKRQNGGRLSQKALAVPLPLQRSRFLRAISGRLGNRFESRFWKNPKLLRGVIGPISTPNDYLNTVFNDIDVISLCESCRNNAHGPHRKSLNLLQFSPCVWKVFPEYVTCRSPSQIETYSLG